ncbi:MAG: hypothetical protein Kow0040_16910 [Thermogutta sp.]
MVWLFFIVVTTLNLLLGVATAMYLRRQIELMQAAEAGEQARETKKALGGPSRAKPDRREAPPETEATPFSSPGNPTDDPDEEAPADLAELRKSLGLSDSDSSTFDSGRTETDPNIENEPPPEGEVAADNWAAFAADIATTAVPPGFLEQASPEGPSADGGTEASSSEQSPPMDDLEDEAPQTVNDQKSESPESTCRDIEFLATAVKRNAAWETSLVDLDEELRRAETASTAEVADHWNRTLQLGQKYLDDLSALREQFRREDSPPPDVALVHEELWADWDAAVAEMQTAARELSLLDARGEPGATRRQLRVLLNRLLCASYRLRDRMQAAYAARAVCEDMASATVPGPRTDERTKYLTPLGLQMHLAPWWQAFGRQRRPLLAAHLDADRIRDWNDRLGHPAVDEIAASLAGFIREIPRQEVVFARVGVAGFLLLSSEMDARGWTQLVERIRQSVETATFEYQGQSVQLTIAAAVTELTGDDTSHTFFERLRGALAEAKKAGGNRTYSDYGRGPTPVVPANIHVRERTVHVESPEVETVAAES